MNAVKWYCVLAFLFSALMVRFVRNLAIKNNCLDTPNERSSHLKPVPNLGGIGIITSFLIILGLYIEWNNAIHLSGYFKLLIGVLVIFFIGIIDDIKGVSYRLRLAIHLVLAILVYFAIFQYPENLYVNLSFLGDKYLYLSLILVVILINFFNFMDGSDAYLGSLTTVFAIIFSGVSGIIGLQTMSGGLLILAASIIGFLVWNWPNASIFMGDNGSTTLGLIFAISILFLEKNGFSFYISLVLISVILGDAFLTLILRALKGESLVSAHKTHFYQQFILAGGGKKQLILMDAFHVVISAGIGISIYFDGKLSIILIPILGISFVIKYYQIHLAHKKSKTYT